ncbi:alpha/beta fold hydrolase [Nostoc sp. TCL26-01]|uniref:alpha/beta fold hydrolase n=1 Tax=Nostoc sp. TCL26-01 TaxID=2576904 RepID=UPI0015BDB62B|nr:alpha/beta hydrolase [Nostoc sp. TCL26-01]QLE58162.1 alpha/beta hydrolase [Nostoc sp. TCL26-01]
MNLNVKDQVSQRGVTAIANTNTDLETLVEHGYADNNGVKIHYASLGQGPLLLMIHGFPDHWYTWHNQMQLLAADYQVVAIDMRGYNLSDKPKGVENYDIRLLIADVVTVIRQLGREKAIVVGHDWGAMVAWQLAMHIPTVVEKLIILNLPHPRGMMRELAHNPQQQQNSQYARDFQQPEAYLSITPEMLSSVVIQPTMPATVQQKYVEALQRSDIQAMLHYYQQNYPREPYAEDPSPVIKVQAPVLMIHGLQDQYLLADGLNNNWEWVDNDLTLVTIPTAGHFVQHDSPDLVTRTIKSWLSR